jgi:hypothetical protein
VYIQVKDTAGLGRYGLSKNGFMQFEPVTVVYVTFDNRQCEKTLKEEDFEVMTVNQFMKPNVGINGKCGAK